MAHQVATSRPVLGPNAIAKYDRELRAIDGIGLSDVEMDSVLTLIAGYVHVAARWAADAKAAERRRSAPAAYNPEHAFEFGVRCVLDGVAMLVRGKSTR